MQPIRDKDLDKLFKNAFEDAEIIPSRDLWSSIESEIDTKKKRVVPLYWLSAAAVLLVATVCFLIYQQQDVKPKQLAAHVEPKSVIPAVETKPVVGTEKDLDARSVNQGQVLTSASKSSQSIEKTAIKEKVKATEKQQVITAPEMQKQETMIAKVEEPQKDLKTKIDEAILQPKQDVVLAQNENIVKTADEVTGDDSENKGIRNVGDVVNLIVNKVDRRKEKFIQFRTDDDDSSISSINIGPFRFGKKNKK
ncbi:hypothetical protein [Pedobacter sp. BMA]|uniref:hypothetical protein n=1 Tax=Pedobacter sp. BMA TaxID=1663685 RepID=UPI0006496544|nr:hypothetical protein [Pedobacter sp. BMA]KLT65977.1 hypothetical protein AB669_07310 [Pedobacter sp. BMA]